MCLQTAVFFCFFCFLPSVFCKPDDIHAIYDEYINEVINFKEIKRKIGKSFSDTSESKLMALKMLDASTKIPSGILVGNAFDLGNFNECYSIEYQKIYGKYCLGTLNFNSSTEKYFEVFGYNNSLKQVAFHIQMLVGLQPQYIGLHYAACVPSNWSAADIPGFLQYSEEFCYSKATELKLSSGAVVTIVILLSFLIIIILSTVFDIYLYYNKKKPSHELLIAFSFLSNGRKIFRTNISLDQLLCLNGIRVISMMWVTLGHEWTSLMIAPVTNVLEIDEWVLNMANMVVLGSNMAVDTFFVVTGLVTVYAFLKSIDKGVKFNLVFYYIHRYTRLTVPLAIVILIYLYLLNYVANGPLWKIVDLTLVKTCEKGWWNTLLYITNYVNDGACLPQGWYLSVDMQLYILSPVVLISLTKWPKRTLCTLVALSGAGCIIPFTLGMTKQLGTLLDSDFESYVKYYYFHTYARFGPYVNGMILGYYLYKIKKSELKIYLSSLAVCASWLVCLTGLTLCLFVQHPLLVATKRDVWINSLYLAFNKPAWSLALCGVIFLCVSGYGEPVDKFLSSPVFQLLNKVSYSMYLLHYPVILVRYASLKEVIRFSNIGQMHIFWSDFMITLFLSLLLSLSFEYPISVLEKYLFGRVSSASAIDKKHA